VAGGGFTGDGHVVLRSGEQPCGFKLPPIITRIHVLQVTLNLILAYISSRLSYERLFDSSLFFA
jgi:hypothetical protein